jgi:hypothetical protein
VLQQLPLPRRQARGSCRLTETCLAAFLAAAEPGTYAHCLYTGDSLLSATHFPEMDYFLGAPNGTAAETAQGSQVFRRWFASGTVVTYDNKAKKGSIKWAGQPTPPPTPAPAYCGAALQDVGFGSHDLGHEAVTASLGECCARCAGVAGCEAYSWHTEQGNTCHFHTRDVHQNAGVVGCQSAFLNKTRA